MQSSAIFREYDPVFPERFEVERSRLAAELQDVAVQIHHVGSTSIPGMPGKGIIDILVTVNVLEPEEAYAAPLKQLGYIRRPVPERPESPFFTRPPVKPRSHNVHIAKIGSRREASMMAFRDYLRTFPEATRRYEEAKRSLATARPGDWSYYSQKKLEIASELEQEAMNWRGKST